MKDGMKTIVVHIPKRCRKPKMDIFDDHIDKVNNARSKKYLPEDTNILAMGMGGQGLIDMYNKKHFGIRKPIEVPTPKKVVKKVVKKKPTKKKVSKAELKKAFQKQKDFINGKTSKNFW
jgi:hypothetical protein